MPGDIGGQECRATLLQQRGINVETAKRCLRWACVCPPPHSSQSRTLRTLKFSLPDCRRPLRRQLVAWLLLLAQAASFLVVPIHSAAHAGLRGEAHAGAGLISATTDRFAALFGHDQGGACDDWSAAFSLDSNPGKLPPQFKAPVPARDAIACIAPAAPQAAEPDPFRARAPPRA